MNYLIQSPQAAPTPQSPQTFGRFDPSLGLVVDDTSGSVWKRGVGWVGPQGSLRVGGQDYAPHQVPPNLQPDVQAMARASQTFLASKRPVADQMRDTTAQVTTPPPPPAPPIPATPPQPHHKLAADSFKHLLGALTGAQGAA